MGRRSKQQREGQVRHDHSDIRSGGAVVRAGAQSDAGGKSEARTPAPNRGASQHGIKPPRVEDLDSRGLHPTGILALQRNENGQHQIHRAAETQNGGAIMTFHF